MNRTVAPFQYKRLRYSGYFFQERRNIIDGNVVGM